MKQEVWFYTSLGVLLSLALYYCLGMCFFFFSRSRPSLKARLPHLSLLSAFGLFLKDAIVLLFLVLGMSPIAQEYVLQIEVYACIGNSSI